MQTKDIFHSNKGFPSPNKLSLILSDRHQFWRTSQHFKEEGCSLWYLTSGGGHVGGKPQNIRQLNDCRLACIYTITSHYVTAHKQFNQSKCLNFFSCMQEFLKGRSNNTKSLGRKFILVAKRCLYMRNVVLCCNVMLYNSSGLTLITPSLSNLLQIIRDSSLPTFILNPIPLWGIPFVPQDNTAAQQERHRQ